MHLFDEADALLHRCQWCAAAAFDMNDGFTARRARTDDGFDRFVQPFGRRRFEQRAQRNRDVELAAEQGCQPCSEQRMATQREEVVANAEARQVQDLFHHFEHTAFTFAARCHALCCAVLWCFGLRKRLAIDFAVG